MATSKQNIHIGGLARSLIQHGIISDEIAQKLAKEAKQRDLSFASHLVAEKHSDAKNVAAIAALEFGVPFFDLGTIDKDVIPKDLVEEKLVRKHHALPLFRRGNRLFIAISDPTNHQGLDEIKFNTGLATEPVVVEADKLDKALVAIFEAADQNIMGDLLDEDLENLDIDFSDGEPKEDDSGLDIDEAPVVRYVNKVLLDGINSGASDLHFEPYEKIYRIRFRQDGILHEVANPPVAMAQRMTARIKVMARMNIAEKRIPQDGRIKMILSKNRSIDFRVNTCPTLYGEKVVMRILDAEGAKIGIEALGFDEEQRDRFMAAINKPDGMILVTGPTGSGKTVSLYTGLNMLNKPGVNISTAEDPVEIQVTGINQVNVNPAQGLTFATALRAFLRQDPDIVMIGEIRDLETAEIGVKAAQTGHLVLSTLHTNDASQTLTRLANMGVPAFNIASSVNLIMAQRLARRLCDACKKPEDIPKKALLEMGYTQQEISSGLTIYKPVGCELCSEGYKGRVGIFEVMPISDAMKRLIMEGASAIGLRDQADKEGINDLRRSGLNKVKEGITSLKELNRVTKE